MKVKKKVTVRFFAIDGAMVKYDPENMGLSSEWGGGGGGQYNGIRTPSAGGGGGGSESKERGAVLISLYLTWYMV